jgi:hypothetical protein
MIKTIIFFSFLCFILSNWVTEEFRNENLLPQHTSRYNIRRQAKRLRFKVNCNQKCNVYLLTQTNARNYDSNQTFVSIYENLNILTDSYENDIDSSKEQILIFIANKNFVEVVKSHLILDFLINDISVGPVFPILS